MKGKCSFKRVAALALSGALVMGAVPLPGLVHEAHAEMYEADTPSSEVYALKEDLGSSTSIGFGLGSYPKKIESGGVIGKEWTIGGTDTEVNGGKDNIAVLAQFDGVMTTFQEWDGTDANQEIVYSDKYGTYESSHEAPSSVYINHY